MGDYILNLTSESIDNRLSKTTQVYEIIRSAIISMRLPPGASIPEKEICQQLDVSRTPVREAILRLATEDLVIVKPGEGTFVNRVILREVLNGQIVRDTLEMRILRLAARRFDRSMSTEFEVALFRQRDAAERKDVDEFFDLDNQFHRLICEVSGYPNVWRTIHGATGQLDRVRRHAFPTEMHFQEVLDEHTRIYECMKVNDEEGAAAVFQVQLDSTFPTIELIRKASPGFLSDEYQSISLSDVR